MSCWLWRPHPDFFLDDRTIRFYREPAAAADAVRARFRGPPAEGSYRRELCAIELALCAYRAADDMVTADDDLNTALQVVLSEAVRMPVFSLSNVAGVEVDGQLTKARLRRLCNSAIPRTRTC